MAIGTIEIAAMILRFVGQTGVTVIGRRPGIWTVAQLTSLAGVEVARIHTARCRAVVTRCARAQNLIVVNRNDRCPNGGAVAVFADIGGRWMRWAFAGRV